MAAFCVSMDAPGVVFLASALLWSLGSSQWCAVRMSPRQYLLPSRSAKAGVCTTNYFAPDVELKLRVAVRKRIVSELVLRAGTSSTFSVGS